MCEVGEGPRTGEGPLARVRCSGRRCGEVRLAAAKASAARREKTANFSVPSPLAARPYTLPVSRNRAALTPAALPIGEALRASAPLARLTERLRESAAMFAAIEASLPSALASHVSPGPLDEAGWSLLAANAAVAAKLRQLVPRFEDRLRDSGHPVAAIRIKVQHR